MSEPLFITLVLCSFLLLRVYWIGKPDTTSGCWEFGWDWRTMSARRDRASIGPGGRAAMVPPLANGRESLMVAGLIIGLTTAWHYVQSSNLAAMRKHGEPLSAS